MSQLWNWILSLFGKNPVAVPAPAPVVIPPVVVAPTPVPQATSRVMNAVEKDLWNLWKKAVPTKEAMREASAVANHIIANLSVYQKVSDQLGAKIPAYFIGCLHYREITSLSLHAYLGNGETIIGTGRKTKLVPAGRGPFADFVTGAVDALVHDGLNKVAVWDLATCLEYAERWNGLGYRRMGVINPYLFSMTSVYVKGKYTSDGHYDPNAVDKELGLAVILQAMKSLGVNLKEVSPA